MTGKKKPQTGPTLRLASTNVMLPYLITRDARINSSMSSISYSASNKYRQKKPPEIDPERPWKCCDLELAAACHNAIRPGWCLRSSTFASEPGCLSDPRGLGQPRRSYPSSPGNSSRCESLRQRTLLSNACSTMVAAASSP